MLTRFDNFVLFLGRNKQMSDEKKSKLLSRDEILGVEDLPVELIDVPEWGGQLRLRGPTVAELDEWDDSVTQRKVEDGKVTITQDFKNHKAKLVVKCLVDEDGDRLFIDEDAERLGRKSPKVISRIYQRLMVLCGRAEEAQKEIEKNSKSEADSTGSSSSQGT
jgi:hypothetical protein